MPTIHLSALKDARDEDIHRQFPEADCDLGIVMKREDHMHQQWLSKIILFKANARWVDNPIEFKKDTHLLPLAAAYPMSHLSNVASL